MGELKSVQKHLTWARGDRLPSVLETRRFAVHVLALTAVVFILGIAAFRSGTFFSSDTGLRFVQVSDLAANGWESFAVDYRGRQFDPSLAHTPFYTAYSVVEGDIYLSISPFFPLVASFFYALLGWVGLAVVPMLGSVLTAVAIYKLGRLSGLVHGRLLLWVTIFATPLLFYSLELWDHTLGVAFASWAVYGVAKGIETERPLPIVLGGVAMGLGLGQRPELYAFSLALGAAILIAGWPRWRRFLAYGVGGLMGAMPVWGLQYLWVTHPLGIPTAKNVFNYAPPPAINPYHIVGRTESLRLARFLAHVEAGMVVPFAGTMLVLVGTALLMLGMWRQENRLLVVAWMPLAAGTLILSLRGLQAPITGVLTTLPLAPLALAYGADRTMEKERGTLLVLWTALLFLLLMVALWPADGGKQWGVRYLLPVFPLGVYLAWCGYDAYLKSSDRRWRRVVNRTMILLVSLGVILQVSGVVHLYRSHSQQVPVRDTLADLSPEVVLTNMFFFGSYMASLEEKTFLYVDDVDVPEALVQRLREEGVQEVVLVEGDERPLRMPAGVVEGARTDAVAPGVTVYAFEGENPR